MTEKYIITRTYNGWVLEVPSQYDDGTEYIRTTVHEDVWNVPTAEANSLCSLLWSAFDYYFQTKHRGGLTIEAKEHGREQE